MSNQANPHREAAQNGTTAAYHRKTKPPKPFLIEYNWGFRGDWRVWNRYARREDRDKQLAKHRRGWKPDGWRARDEKSQ